MAEDFEDDGIVPGVVDVFFGLKLNIGNYSSAELNISVNEPYSGLPGNTKKEKIAELFSFLQEEVNTKIIQAVNKAHSTAERVNPKKT